MAGIDTHWRIVDRALSSLDLGWDAWPQVVVDERITPPVRVSAVLVLLATDEADVSNPEDLVISMSVDDEDTLDWLGRARHPWQQLARLSLSWDAETASTAVRCVATRRTFDERRVALALRGAKQICDRGEATADLVDALQACADRLDQEADYWSCGPPAAYLARRGQPSCWGSWPGGAPPTTARHVSLKPWP